MDTIFTSRGDLFDSNQSQSEKVKWKIEKKQSALQMTLMAVVILQWLCLGTAALPPRPERPNVAIIVMDDLRPMFR